MGILSRLRARRNRQAAAAPFGPLPVSEGANYLKINPAPMSL
jgi:hypothetical protein